MRITGADGLPPFGKKRQHRGVGHVGRELPAQHFEQFGSRVRNDARQALHPFDVVVGHLPAARRWT
jgi:hypothetical protein